MTEYELSNIASALIDSIRHMMQERLSYVPDSLKSYYLTAYDAGVMDFLEVLREVLSEVHTKTGTTRNYYDEARRNILKQAAVKEFNEIEFVQSDYRELSFANSVIYCDPPYAGTTQYSDSFNHSEFWDTMRKWSENNIVLISEETAPSDFKVIWQGDVKRTQDNASRSTATEKLLIYERTII